MAEQARREAPTVSFKPPRRRPPWLVVVKLILTAAGIFGLLLATMILLRRIFSGGP